MWGWSAAAVVRVLKIAVLLLPAWVANAQTVEEQRLDLAQEKIPAVVAVHADLVKQFSERLAAVANPAELIVIVNHYAGLLWHQARENVQHSVTGDDRPLYWSRLALSRYLRQQSFPFEFDLAARQQRLAQLERASRGHDDIRYADATERVFVTGFDPFRLDAAIDQSNPSGLAALALDGNVLQIGKRAIRIEAVLIPVRFADFDQGLIESVLTPILRDPAMKLVTTISMGRSGFDLERFPGRRRSADAFDNVNTKTGGSAKRPVLPLLDGASLAGAEFVEFSLPARSMQSVQQPFPVTDNGKVTTLAGSVTASVLSDLRYHTAVGGSGGGYLSNEISYRSIRLRDELGLHLPVGHVHTPAVRGYDAGIEHQIVQQLEQMLRAALDSAGSVR